MSELSKVPEVSGKVTEVSEVPRESEASATARFGTYRKHVGRTGYAGVQGGSGSGRGGPPVVRSWPELLVRSASRAEIIRAKRWLWHKSREAFGLCDKASCTLFKPDGLGLPGRGGHAPA